MEGLLEKERRSKEVELMFKEQLNPLSIATSIYEIKIDSVLSLD